MERCRSKIWLENISQLFCCYNIIPLEGMDIESQMNSITRLVLIIFIILMLFNYKNSVLFLLLSLLFIIILYYIQRNQMEHFKTERYTPKQKIQQPLRVKNSGLTLSKNSNGKMTMLIDRPQNYRFCDDLKLDTYNNTEYVSPSQKLVGGPNPKTQSAPVVVAPIADLNYWRANNLINHSAINETTNTDLYQSGYLVSTCCGYTNNKQIGPCSPNSPPPPAPSPPPPENPPTKENYGGRNRNVHSTIEKYGYFDNQNIVNPRTPIDLDAFAKYNQNSGNNVSNQNTNNQNGQNNNNQTGGVKFPFEIRPNESGQVNTTCGYNPEQLITAGLPTNYSAGNCEKNPLMKEYNTNLFTQTIQPGVYTRSQINEPINSNIGISFTQQFEPTSCSTDSKGNVLYTLHDPRFLQEEIIEPNLDVINAVNESNVYDPRFTGYGTSYRSYTENMTGQTRFFYDDINAIRMPNYISRSNIDFERYADSYGPIQEGNANGNKFNPDIRALAQDSFCRNAIGFRDSMQQSLMRKTNANAWQQRVAPIRTNGSVGSCMSRR